MDTIIKASSDIFVKYLLGSEHNKDLLLGFINAVFADNGFRPIASVEIKNPFNPKEFSVDKGSILDVKASDESGRLFDIEVQATGNETYRQRALFYWARLYSQQIKQAEHYIKLNPAISINILDFILIPANNRFHNLFLLRENSEPELILTDHLMIHFLELPKLVADLKQDPAKIDKSLYHWLLFFKEEGMESPLLKTIVESDPIIQKAHQEYSKFSGTDQYREAYEARLKWQRDQDSLIYFARLEGEAQGIAKGEAKGKREDKIETARNMKADGIPTKTIAKYTGLSVEEIEKL